MEGGDRSALERDHVRAIFLQWDTGQTGVIDRDELSEALLKLGLSASKTEIDVFFRAADLNKDGVISYAEFVDYLFQPAISAEARANLRSRFPDASEEQIAVALAMADGHGGNAARALQKSAADSEAEGAAESVPLPLRVHTLGGSTTGVAVALTSTVLALKTSLEQTCGIPAREQVLTVEGSALADDAQFGDLCVRGAAISSVVMSDGLDVHLVRVRLAALLCADALTHFYAKNLTTTPIDFSVNGNFVRTIDVGEVWQYAKTNFWNGSYFDLDLNGCGWTIASENGANKDTFAVQASDEFGHTEHWGLKFVVKGYDCSAEITDAPRGDEAH